jgi:hypothetical protein
LVNNFKAVAKQLQEMEPTFNASDLTFAKSQDPDMRQIHFMVNKHFEALKFWVDRAVKREVAKY